MPPVDAFASYPHYAHHIQPVWDALPEQGTFYTTGSLGAGPLTLVAGFPDIKRTRHRRQVLIEHGAGENWGSTDPHYSGGAGRESVALFVCPSEEVLARNLDRYDAAGVVANPRVEYLKQLRIGETIRRQLGSGDGRLRVVVSFHWDNRTWDHTRSALPYYYPYLSEMTGVELRGHAHPRIAERAKQYYSKAGIPYIETFDEVVQWADVYACDNSSTIFEAKAVGIPVVLLDAPWFSPLPGSLRFDRFAHIGPLATPQTLVEMAMHANSNRVVYDVDLSEIFGRIEGSTAAVVEAIEAVTNDHSRPASGRNGSPAGTSQD